MKLTLVELFPSTSAFMSYCRYNSNRRNFGRPSMGSIKFDSLNLKMDVKLSRFDDTTKIYI